MDRFRCAQCGGAFYFDLRLEGMKAEPGEKLGLACPLCEHQWSYYAPEDLDLEETLQ